MSCTNRLAKQRSASSMIVKLSTNSHSLSSAPFAGSDKVDVSMEDSSSAEEEKSGEGDKYASNIGNVDAGDRRQLVGVEIANEMDEFGYTGFDQIVEEEVSSDKAALCPNEVDGAF